MLSLILCRIHHREHRQENGSSPLLLSSSSGTCRRSREILRDELACTSLVHPFMLTRRPAADSRCEQNFQVSRALQCSLHEVFRPLRSLCYIAGDRVAIVLSELPITYFFSIPLRAQPTNKYPALSTCTAVSHWPFFVHCFENAT